MLHLNMCSLYKHFKPIYELNFCYTASPCQFIVLYQLRIVLQTMGSYSKNVIYGPLYMLLKFMHNLSSHPVYYVQSIQSIQDVYRVEVNKTKR